MTILKKSLALLLMLALVLSLGVSAFAVNAQYSTTQEFLKALDAEKVKYRYMGVNNNDKEEVTVSYTGDYCDDIFINIFFSQDLDSVSMRFWNIVDFDEADYAKALELANELNADFKYVKFVVDTDDWSIGAEIDIPIREGEDSAQIAYDALYYIVQISDEAYPDLAELALPAA